MLPIVPTITTLALLAVVLGASTATVSSMIFGLLATELPADRRSPALNLVYLPMSFLSGLWFPLPMLPKVLQGIAPVWPSYHLDRIALAAVGLPAVLRTGRDHGTPTLLPLPYQRNLLLLLGLVAASLFQQSLS